MIIYYSTIVHSQHLTLLSKMFSNIQLTQIVFPATSRMLAKRFKATQSPSSLTYDTSVISSIPTNMMTPKLHDTIATQIQQINLFENKWNPDKHTTIIGSQMYVKIKSHQLRSNRHPKYNAKPQSCLTLVHINHLVNKTC